MRVCEDGGVELTLTPTAYERALVSVRASAGDVLGNVDSSDDEGDGDDGGDVMNFLSQPRTSGRTVSRTYKAADISRFAFPRDDEPDIGDEWA